MNKPKVLIVTANPLHNGPRLIREIDLLKSLFEVVAVGSTPPHDNTIEYISSNSIKPSLFDRVLNKVFRIFTSTTIIQLPFEKLRIKKLIKRVNPDIVIVHQPRHLPTIITNKKFYKYKVVFNAHEFYPLEFETNKQWMRTNGRLFGKIYKRYLSQVDLLINVCESIAERCLKEYVTPSIVVPNASVYYPLLFPSAVNPHNIRLIHHGGAIREREIELMIESVLKLPKHYSLDLMLIPSDKSYYDELIQKYSGTEQIKFINPVTFNDIIPFINSYDIGIFNLPPYNYNYKVALPNKLFEFIQGRLCIVVGPSVEMKEIVNRYNLGAVSADFSITEFSKAILSLTIEDIQLCKENSSKAALELSSEQYQKLYLDQVKLLIK